MKKKEKEKKDKPKYSVPQCVGYMFSRAWKYRRRVFLFSLSTILISIAAIVLNFLTTPTILRRLEEGAPLKTLLLTIGFFMGASLVLGCLRTYNDGNKLYPKVALRSAIIDEISQKCATTSYPNFLDGDFKRRLENTHGAVNSNSAAAEDIWNTLDGLAVSVITFFVFLGYLTNLHPVLLAVIIITTVADFFFTRWCYGWSYRHRDESGEYSRKANYLNRVVGRLPIIKETKLFGLQDWLNDVFESIYQLAYNFAVRRERFGTFTAIFGFTLTFLRNGIAYFVLIRMCLNDGLSAAEFLLYFSAVGEFTSRLNGIMNGYSTLYNHSIGLSNILEFLNTPEPFKFDDGEHVPEEFTYEIKLQNVSYTYPGADKKIIDNLSLTIHKGENVAIVGLNGAGKTTLVKLMCGFIDPDEGCVLLNGVDIRTLNRREYYGLFSAVFQQFSVIDITVAENIAQSVEEIDMDRVWECIDKAGLRKTVEELPNGIDTHIGREVYLDGVMLSGGQTQRLMLARALYKNGAILMLDEPTAALDPLAENDIYMKYNEMTKGKTSVFISHRLASTRFCDRIVYLADGVVAEQGTHEELLKLGGGYANLFEIQSRYYREGSEF